MLYPLRDHGEHWGAMGHVFRPDLYFNKEARGSRRRDEQLCSLFPIQSTHRRGRSSRFTTVTNCCTGLSPDDNSFDTA